MECYLCLDSYKDPRILPECSHSFCKTCINQYIEASYLIGNFPCPRCRVKSPLTWKKADDFKKNIDLAAAIEEVEFDNKKEMPRRSQSLRREVESCRESVYASKEIKLNLNKTNECVNKLDSLKGMLDNFKESNETNIAIVMKDLSEHITAAESVLKGVTADAVRMADENVVIVLLKEQQSVMNNEIDKHHKILTTSLQAQITMINIVSSWNQRCQAFTSDCDALRLFFDPNSKHLLGQCSNSQSGDEVVHIYDNSQLTKIQDLKTVGVSTRYGMLATVNKGLFVANAKNIVQMELQNDRLVEQRCIPYEARAICAHSETSFLFYGEEGQIAFVSLYDMDSDQVVNQVKVPKSRYSPNIAYNKAINSFVYTYKPGADQGDRMVLTPLSENHPSVELFPGRVLHIHTDHLDNTFILWYGQSRLFWLNPSTSQPEEVMQLHENNVYGMVYGSIATDMDGYMYIYNYAKENITKYRYLPV